MPWCTTGGSVAAKKLNRHFTLKHNDNPPSALTCGICLVQNEFNPEGVLQAMPDVVFHNLPASKTLTMNPKVPEPWLVEPTMAV